MAPKRVWVERSKKWVFKFDLHYADLPRYRETIDDVGQSKSQLDEYEGKLLANLRKKAGERKKTGALFSEWVAYYQSQQRTKTHTVRHTYSNAYGTTINKLNQALGHLPGTQTRDSFNTFIAKEESRSIPRVKKSLDENGKVIKTTYQAKLSFTSIYNYRKYYRIICNFACREDAPEAIRISESDNPSRGIKIGEAPRRHNRPLMAWERKAYLEICDSLYPWFRPVVDFVRTIPIRNEDLVVLKVADKRGVGIMTLEQQVRYYPNKTNKPGTRPIMAAAPIFPIVKKFMMSRINDRKCPYVFFQLDKNGQREPLNYWTIDRVHRSICLKAGIEDMIWYDWRHDSVNLLLSFGYSDQEIMTMAGWKTNMVEHYNTRDLHRLSDKSKKIFAETSETEMQIALGVA